MEEDRSRWSRLIVFTLVLVLVVIVAIWWAGWLTMAAIGPPPPGAD